ncbi:hypothetical protein AMS68_001011 [Peltaster fructicola]|uniref:H/ACA ribonucleoprotein complex subunit 2 n=1 Tax=Peltaster fructicola TaxID=286661 RepID=A0A6H0XL89_9PEZI|nr:hypothetical protein AMS68_001011 [Peltaster fructicola]
MAKDKSEADLREKKEKKDKKRKREEAATEDAAPVKKEKKDKKRKSDAADLDTNSDTIMTTAPTDDVDDTQIEKSEVPLAALVPFANPLADDKAQKKVLKSVKKAAKNKALKRGVKECVKAIRKSPPGNPATLMSANESPSGIVILAADISPMDVISHIPVLCEDHNIPYIFVPSRAELGAAGSTKRPTSVVLISAKAGKGVEGESVGEWNETYKDLHKLSLKLGQTVKV